MGGTFTGSKAWFLNPSSGVSAHYLIRKDGYILQMVKDEDRAWHAGITWSSTPKERCAAIIQRYWRKNSPNDYTIGIEVESSGEQFTQAQYTALSDLTRELCSKYKIPVTREFLIGHYEVNPINKAGDPTELSWDRLINLVNNTPMANFDFTLTKVGADIHLLMNFAAIGPFVTKDKTTGQVTDTGNILDGMDKIVSPNCTKRLYEVTFNGVSKQLDLRDTPPIDTCEVDLAAEKVITKNLTTELTAARARVSDLLTINERNTTTYGEVLKQKDQEIQNQMNYVKTLTDELVSRDATIRYMKANLNGYGKWEKFVTWLKSIFIIKK